MTPERRVCHLAVCLEHYILIFGGMWKSVAYPLHDIWMYNIYTEKWMKHVIPPTEMAPSQRYGACAVLIKSEVYMFGGVRNAQEHPKCNVLWKLSRNQQASFIWNKIVILDNMKSPSPRCHHTGWEYAEKLWIFGGRGRFQAQFLNTHGDFLHHFNNQVFYFNACTKEWENPRCSGSVPTPRCGHATTVIIDIVWLYGGRYHSTIFDDLYKLNMCSLTWTQIQTGETKPQGRCVCSLNAVTDSHLVLHGGVQTHDNALLNDTWMLDLPSQTWSKYTAEKDHGRKSHRGCLGINKSLFIIGGTTCSMPRQGTCTCQCLWYKTIFHIILEPCSLQ